MQNYQFLNQKLKIIDKSRKILKKCKLGMEVILECDRIVM